jgi:lysozyme
MNFSELRKEIKREEGWSGTVYQDSLGFWTIGFGFLVDSRKGDKLPMSVAEAWLDYKIQEKVDALFLALPWLTDQPEEVQNALINMAYQLGVEGLLKFKNTLALLKAGDRQGAADNALKSLWARQTPQRAKRVTDMIRGA